MSAVADLSWRRNRRGAPKFCDRPASHSRIRPASVDETPRAGERPVDYVERLAEEKAAAVPAAPDEIVLGADTTVVIDGEMLGKPADEADARRMLTLLAGRRHEVMTGICLKRGEEAAYAIRPSPKSGSAR